MKDIMFGSKAPVIPEDGEEWRRYTVLCMDCRWYTDKKREDGQRICSKYNMWSHPDQTCKSGKEKS